MIFMVSQLLRYGEYIQRNREVHIILYPQYNSAFLCGHTWVCALYICKNMMHRAVNAGRYKKNPHSPSYLENRDFYEMSQNTMTRHPWLDLYFAETFLLHVALAILVMEVQFQLLIPLKVFSCASAK